MQHMSQSPTAPDFVQNPYDFYTRARGLGDVIYWDDYKMPAAVSHRAVKALLSDKRLGRAAPPQSRNNLSARMPKWQELEDNSMLELEPPRHTRLRALVLRAFTRHLVPRK